MSELNSRGDDLQVDEIKEFVGKDGLKIIEEDGLSKLSLDIAALPELTAEMNPATDYTLIYDVSEAGHRKALVQDLPSSSASVATFQLDQQVFSVNGSYTWTKPAGAKAVYVVMCGAGGGGGGGRRGVTNTDKVGGNGGGAGGKNELWFRAAALPDTVTVTVGVGGTGGLAAAGDSLNGGAGTAGTSSRFGDYLNASGGSGGPGGYQYGNPTASTSGGAVVWNGAAGGASNDGGGYTGGDDIWGPGGGGGGGGQDLGQGVGNAGGAGGVCTTATHVSGRPAGGGAGVNGAAATSHASVPWFGHGGGGGGSAYNAPAGNGGNGINGGGGGGGGSSTNGYESGYGGNGGDGLVIVLSFF